MKFKKKIIKKTKNFKSKYRKKRKSISNFNSELTKKLFFIICLLILYICSFIDYKSQVHIVKESVFREIVSFENNLNLTSQMFAEFREINCNNKLIEGNKKFKKSWYPDISVIITIYNQAHIIYKCLRSVQNQSLKNIEIIMIDDCSLDNSVDVIKNFQKEDKRIILISHNLNEGTIKSRTDGVRKAKGKYITIIDGDDALIHKDILKNSLYIAQKANLDVVEFRARKYVNEKYKGEVYNFDRLNVTYILYQPELRGKFFPKERHNKYKIFNRVIWGKLIKKKIFLNLLNYIGPDITDDYITDYEDTIMAVSLFHLAQSYYVMKEVGLYYSFSIKNKKFEVVNTKCKKNEAPRQMGFYYLLKFLVDKNNKTEKEKKKTYDEYNEYLTYYSNTIFGLKLNKKHFQIIFDAINKFLEWDCVNNKQKKKIQAYKNRVIEKMKRDNISLSI